MRGRVPSRVAVAVLCVFLLAVPEQPLLTTPPKLPDLSWLLGPIEGALGAIARAVVYVVTLQWLIGDARAACAGGTCYWIGGSGNFNDGTHWSTSSGGASCGCTPASTDAVVYDTNSGAGTSTLVADSAIGSLNMGTILFLSPGMVLSTGLPGYTLTVNGPVTIATNDTLDAHAARIVVYGDWDSFGGSFLYGTSTLEFAASANLKAAGVYNMLVDDTVRVTLTHDLGVANLLTVDAPTSGGLAGSYVIFLVPASSTLLSLNVGSRTDWCAVGITLAFLPTVAVSAYDVPAAYYGCHVDIESSYIGTTTATALGDMTFAHVLFVSPLNATARVVFAMTTHKLTLPFTVVQIGGGASGGTQYSGVVSFTTGSFRVTNTSFSVFNKVSYLVFGSGHHYFNATIYTDFSTSGSWDAGTGTVTFGGAYLETPCFAPPAMPVPEFNNLNFDNGGSNASVQYQMLQACPQRLWARGHVSLSSSGPAGKIGLNLEGFNATFGSYSSFRWGNITTGAAFNNTVTVYGDWDDHNASSVWNTGSTIVWAGNATLYSPTTGEYYWHVTVNPGVTLRSTESIVVINGVFRMYGTYIAVGGAEQTTLLQMRAADPHPLVLGPNSDMRLSGYFIYDNLGGMANYYVTPAVYQHLDLAGPTNTSATLSGNVSTWQCDRHDDAAACAIITLVEPQVNGSIFRIYMNGFDLRSGGVLWVGDVYGSVYLYVGTGTVSAHGFNPRTTSRVYLQNGTILAYPSVPYNPIAVYVTQASTIYGGNGTVIAHGAVSVWPFEAAGARILAQNSRWRILADMGNRSPFWFFGNPGDLSINDPSEYIDFGTSRWVVGSNVAFPASPGLILAEGVRFILRPGTHIVVPRGFFMQLSGDVFWNGNSTALVRVIGLGPWNVTQVPYGGITADYASGSNATVSDTAGITSCVGGVDMGGNVHWYFPGSSQCNLNDVTDILPALIAIILLGCIFFGFVAVFFNVTRRDRGGDR